MYRNELTFVAETAKEIASNECKTLSGSCQPQYDFDRQTLIEQAIAAIPEAVSQELEEKAREQGFSWKLLEVRNIDAELIERSTIRQFRDWTFVRSYARLRISATVVFESDKPVVASPVPLVVMQIIKWIIEAIVLIIIGIVAVEALKTWLLSMTTKTWKVQTFEYDEEGNLVKKTQEEGSVPDPIGIGMVAIFMLAAMVLLLFWFVGRPRRKK